MKEAGHAPGLHLFDDELLANSYHALTRASTSSRRIDPDGDAGPPKHDASRLRSSRHSHSLRAALDLRLPYSERAIAPALPSPEQGRERSASGRLMPFDP